MTTKPGVDLLLVNAPGKKRVYQVLADELAAIEPPIWAGFIASFARKNGISVDILDAEAYMWTYEETVKKIVERNPLLCVFVVYGQQPSASTQSMPAAGDLCRMLKEAAPQIKTMFMGTHSSALPKRTLEEEATDFVVQGEGPYTIRDTIKAIKNKAPTFSGVPGLWYKDDQGKTCSNPPALKIQDLDNEIPGMAWDLLPMDRYRAHNWHCWTHIKERQPYASLYTSLGCPYKCSFCCINAPFGGSGIRYFSPEHIIREIDLLVTKYGVKNIKIADEMFVLNPRHVLGLCDFIIERGYKLNIWAYARVDTVKDKYLEKLKQAGFNWLGIGVESGSKFVRDGVEKGRFGDVEIKGIINKIREHDIYVGANYIFGLPDDTIETMQETLNLAMELNTEWANFYCAMAYPGSPLHAMAEQKKLPLPELDGVGWIGYSQHAFETYPLPTDKVPQGKVITFRDNAFNTYFTSDSYLSMMERKFGSEAVNHVKEMTKLKLKRKYAIPL
ncbi:MAG: B12-binding domain-containing radical SAM protein [Oligoflexia bacterium]|nr:B12-binding domain-containing radical SAM protein [Oligoflexia bacterium]